MATPSMAFCIVIDSHARILKQCIGWPSKPRPQLVQWAKECSLNPLGVGCPYKTLKFINSTSTWARRELNPRLRASETRALLHWATNPLYLAFIRKYIGVKLGTSIVLKGISLSLFSRHCKHWSVRQKHQLLGSGGSMATPFPFL